METFINKIIQGDSLEVLKTLPAESVDCIITSPPYWALRDYGTAGQLGLEPTMQEYVTKLCNVFDEVKRVLKKDGTCFVNIGDTYFGGNRNKGNSKPHPKAVRGLTNLGDTVTGPKGQNKALAQIPSRFAIEMASRGWILRNEIIWHKPNCMPSSVKDRFTVDFEKVFFFVKSKRYRFETQYEPFLSNAYDKARMAKAREVHGGKWADHSGGAIKTQRAFVAGGKQGRTKRCVWSICTKPFKSAHFATFPEALVEPMIKAGCPKGAVVLDPFMGACTTAVVARKLGRNYIGIELNSEYIKICDARLLNVQSSLL